MLQQLYHTPTKKVNTQNSKRIIEGVALGEYRLFYLGKYIGTSYAPTEMLALRERAEMIAEIKAANESDTVYHERGTSWSG